MNEMNRVQPITDEQLDTVTGGVSQSAKAEVYCPHCGHVTVATGSILSIYTCTICNNKHNGERVLPKPRG